MIPKNPQCLLNWFTKSYRLVGGHYTSPSAKPTIGPAYLYCARDSVDVARIYSPLLFFFCLKVSRVIAELVNSSDIDCVDSLNLHLLVYSRSGSRCAQLPPRLMIMLLTENSMLLVLLCFMTLVGLMVVIKACCQSEMFCRREESPDCSSDSVVQVSVVESTVSAISIPDVVFERSCRMNGNVNDDFIDIDFSLPPSYEEAVKMPLPFRSSS